jgi:hypothetical protein
LYPEDSNVPPSAVATSGKAGELPAAIVLRRVVTAGQSVAARVRILPPLDVIVLLDIVSLDVTAPPLRSVKLEFSIHLALVDCPPEMVEFVIVVEEEMFVIAASPIFPTIDESTMLLVEY